MSFSDIPLEFAIFGATLLGVALFHHHTLAAALAGLAAALVLRYIRTSSLYEIVGHFEYEWVVLANLLLLLLGFAILSNQFERSHLPEAIPPRLPGGWVGGLSLLALVFTLSIFLDNIAAATIGGVLARHVYRDGVTIAFLAAIVSAANAGGAGSVIGDTTTTMMWISGISPLELLPGFVGAFGALAVLGPLASIAQQKRSPLTQSAGSESRIDWIRVAVVLFALATLIATNVTATSVFPGLEELAPALGLGLWAALLAAAPLRMPDWSILREAMKGALFLVSLVALASLMPVARLPPPSAASTLGLGFLSAVFDNIPLTALAINQSGYDWALLAYAVGFGGSMVWFGSSAGVALTNLYPEARSVANWVREGWFIPVSYVVGFLIMVAASRVFTGGA
jgi:Na+/H+ antiporter NhaD/arsenite permease-like protein